VLRGEFKHGTDEAFLDRGRATLEQTLKRAVNQYEGFLEENPAYEPPMIGDDLKADTTKSLEVLKGSLVAEQFRYPADHTRQQTAYLLKRFYESREEWKDFHPCRDAAKQAMYWGLGTSTTFTVTTGPSWQGLAIGGFAAMTAAGHTYLKQYMNPRDRPWLENKTLDDIDRTAAYIRRNGGRDPNDGDVHHGPPITPDGTNVYNPSRTPMG
jgi:hypothetical protein